MVDSDNKCDTIYIIINLKRKENVQENHDLSVTRNINLNERRKLEDYLLNLWKDDDSRDQSEKKRDAITMVDKSEKYVFYGYDPKEFGFDRWIGIFWNEGPILYQGFNITGKGPLVEAYCRRRRRPLPLCWRLLLYIQNRCSSLYW